MKVNKINLNSLKRDHWSDQDVKNAEIAIDFAQKIMNDHDFEGIVALYGKHTYKQHNQTMVDGVQGVLQAMRELVGNFPDFSYDVRHVYVDGEYVTLHSHATLTTEDRGNPQRGFNIYDTWKIVEGEIVEHWDAIQGIDEAMRKMAVQSAGVVRNENTYF
ncbi:MAG TPA: polyketide cyclase [Cytophagales bacterium]|nr:polyketide cyclase [Cytophagales bacterium]HAA21304.1 polyketide cyclase [Cytophagales bacterium]HAP59909.1 polyketide cyclase [Cytophagales bacterium]